MAKVSLIELRAEKSSISILNERRRVQGHREQQALASQALAQPLALERDGIVDDLVTLAP
jgi:hypothetical protein